ncbi:MAG: sporulation transcriptional regulator SpoIIID [Ruminococcaceae bacterium]|nr:sporulation transcriptional regulator SpoIIID [Oscillospiraceae bacterium]
MKENVEERALQLGEYIAKTNATVRLAAKKYNVSKSTVHKDVSERLKTINMPLYKEVRKVLDQNKEERHIRGGIATKQKYQKITQNIK